MNHTTLMIILSSPYFLFGMEYISNPATVVGITKILPLTPPSLGGLVEITNSNNMWDNIGEVSPAPGWPCVSSDCNLVQHIDSLSLFSSSFRTKKHDWSQWNNGLIGERTWMLDCFGTFVFFLAKTFIWLDVMQGSIKRFLPTDNPTKYPMALSFQPLGPISQVLYQCLGESWFI